MNGSRITPHLIACIALALLAAACRDPSDGISNQPPGDYDGWTVVTALPGDNLQALADAAKNRTVLQLQEGTYPLAPQGGSPYGLVLEGKTDFAIRGAGRFRTKVVLPSDMPIAFYVSSRLDNVTLEDFCIEGTLPLQTNTHAIGNYTGPGYSENIRRIRIRNLYIRNVAVGISIANWYEGNVYDDVEVSGNLIENMIGTEPGYGYGIHIDTPTHARILRNIVRNAGRHGIYHGRSASGSAELIAENLVLEHGRTAVGPLRVAAALVCARSSDVLVFFNTVLDSRLYSMSVEPDDVFGWQTEDILLVGNSVYGAEDAGLWIATGKPHTALGNSVNQAPGNPYPELRLELYPGSALVDPLSGEPASETVLTTRWGGYAFALSGGRLRKIGQTLWPSASYLQAGAYWLYVGLAGGGCVRVDPLSLGPIEPGTVDRDPVSMRAVVRGEWIADGATETAVDIVLDARGLPGCSCILAEWDLSVGEGAELVSAALLGTYRFILKPGSASPPQISLDECRIVDGSLLVWTEHAGISTASERGHLIDETRM